MQRLLKPLFLESETSDRRLKRQMGRRVKRKHSADNKPIPLCPDADSCVWSSDDGEEEEMNRKRRSASSPPTFLPKKLIDESNDKLAEQGGNRTCVRKLADIAAPAPARTKKEKESLVKYFCADCENYYNTFPERNPDKTACRHRRVEVRPVTPPGFWDPYMPVTP